MDKMMDEVGKIKYKSNGRKNGDRHLAKQGEDKSSRFFRVQKNYMPYLCSF